MAATAPSEHGEDPPFSGQRVRAAHLLEGHVVEFAPLTAPSTAGECAPPGPDRARTSSCHPTTLRDEAVTTGHSGGTGGSRCCPAHARVARDRSHERTPSQTLPPSRFIPRACRLATPGTGPPGRRAGAGDRLRRGSATPARGGTGVRALERTPRRRRDAAARRVLMWARFEALATRFRPREERLAGLLLSPVAASPTQGSRPLAALIRRGSGSGGGSLCGAHPPVRVRMPVYLIGAGLVFELLKRTPFLGGGGWVMGRPTSVSSCLDGKRRHLGAAFDLGERGRHLVGATAAVSAGSEGERRARRGRRRGICARCSRTVGSACGAPRPSFVALAGGVIERLPVGLARTLALPFGQLGEQVAHTVNGAALAV